MPDSFSSCFDNNYTIVLALSIVAIQHIAGFDIPPPPKSDTFHPIMAEINVVLNLDTS